MVSTSYSCIWLLFSASGPKYQANFSRSCFYSTVCVVRSQLFNVPVHRDSLSVQPNDPMRPPSLQYPMRRKFAFMIGCIYDSAKAIQGVTGTMLFTLQVGFSANAVLNNCPCCTDQCYKRIDLYLTQKFRKVHEQIGSHSSLRFGLTL
jgi:hypothetical protein